MIGEIYNQDGKGNDRLTPPLLLRVDSPSHPALYLSSSYLADKHHDPGSPNVVRRQGNGHGQKWRATQQASAANEAVGGRVFAHQPFRQVRAQHGAPDARHAGDASKRQRRTRRTPRQPKIKKRKKRKKREM